MDDYVSKEDLLRIDALRLPDRTVAVQHPYRDVRFLREPSCDDGDEIRPATLKRASVDGLHVWKIHTVCWAERLLPILPRQFRRLDFRGRK